MADVSDEHASGVSTPEAEPVTAVLERRWNQLLERVRRDPGRMAEAAVSFGAVVLCTALVLRTLHADLLWADTTPTGGDMGAHVWGPRYLLDHLLPHLRLSGWTPDWYNGFPAYQFYMVIPALLIVMLHVGLAWWAAALAVIGSAVATVAGFVQPRLVRYRWLILAAAVLVVVLAVPMPYNRAFKVVSGIGLLGLPLACWAFAKLSDLPFPAPPLAAAASLVFAYNREPLYNATGNIIGGNFPSTMAGEFAFSISLTLSVLYLGVAVRGLKTGRHRALAAALFALAGLTHLIPAFFVLACTAALLVTHPDRQRFRWLATMVPVAGLLTAWWVVPFWWRRDYVNDMGWEKLPLPGAEQSDAGMAMAGDQGSVWYYLLPPGLRWLLVVALFGVVVSVIRRYSVGVVLGLAWGGVMVAFAVLPQTRLWNARLLPFLYLSVSLLAAIGAAEVIRLLAVAGSGRPERPLRWVSVPLASVAVVGVLVYSMLPLSGLFDGASVFGWKPITRVVVSSDGETVTESRFLAFSTTAVNPVGGWASWNYSGLEAKQPSPGGCSEPDSPTACRSGGWPEYRALVATMAEIGADPELGCGRAFWEYEKERVEGYGTPMAPMLLPFWTDGCIGSQEGLYFESSPTVPHHFLMQAELSAGPSQPQRGLPYPSFDMDAGVRHLQMLGVRYYLASTPTAINAAAAHPDLTEIAVSGPWHVYLVADAEPVAPLRYEPVVVEGIDESQHGWLPTAVAWFLDDESLDVPIAAHGPDEWARVEAVPVPDDTRDLVRWVREQLGERGPMDQVPELPRTELHRIEVTDIVQARDRISFRVSQPGVPVLVRTSYFPNWVASGADGPYRVAPNLMVVVPTDTEVTLDYTRTPVDLAAMAMSAVGLVLLVLLARRPPVAVEPLKPTRLSLAIDDLLRLPPRGGAAAGADDPLVGSPGDDPLVSTGDDLESGSHAGIDPTPGAIDAGAPPADPLDPVDPPPVVAGPDPTATGAEPPTPRPEERP